MKYSKGDIVTIKSFPTLIHGRETKCEALHESWWIPDNIYQMPLVITDVSVSNNGYWVRIEADQLRPTYPDKSSYRDLWIVDDDIDQVLYAG